MHVAVTAEQLVGLLQRKISDRGLSVYSVSELMGVAGRAKDGHIVSGFYQRPIFRLDPWERIEIFNTCAPVMGIVTSRQNRIAALEWNVVPDRKQEDRIASALGDLKSVYDEHEGLEDARALTLRATLAARLRRELPGLRPDLGNFNGALARWRRRLKERHEDRSSEIEDWLLKPNQRDTFGDICKKIVFDLMIQGAGAVFKKARTGLLESWHILPGGTVYPMKGRYAGSPELYAQVLPSAEEAQVFGPDELSYMVYIPSSAQDYGFVPLDALINKIAETLLFDRLSAEQADGSRPPEYLVIFSERMPFGDLDQPLEVPIDKKEAKRLETVVNEIRKGAVKVLSGVGSGEPKVVNLTKSDTFPYYKERQQQIKEDIALVWNASNLEVNLTGSGDTSGRATSESQERTDRVRGIFPMMAAIETLVNMGILPFKFGGGYHFQFESGLTEAEKVKLSTEKARSGLYAVNEVRVSDLGLDPYPEKEYDRPSGPAQPQQAPLGTAEEPIFTADSRRR